MRKTTLLKSMLLLCALIVGSGSVWGENYTITFSNGASSATGISTNTNATTTVASASRSYVATKPFTDISGNCYYGGSSDAEKTCIRVGKSGNSASLTISLSEAGRVKATSIVVNCFKFNDSNKGTIAVNGMAAQSVPTSSAGDLTFTYAVPTNITTIVLSTTKATFVYSITVNYVIETGEETAVNIDASGITNTDIYTSTIGGKLKATVVDESVAPIDGAVVSWSSNNKKVAKVGSDGTITLVGIGSVTITANYAGITGTYKSSSKTYALTVTDSNPAPNDGSAEKPYTVSEAIAAYDAAGSDVADKYITGIVKGFYNDNSTPNGSGQLSYWISADGSGNDFEIYNGKSIGGANFTTSPDNRVAIGDRVVVLGTITYYAGGSVYELKADNKLVSKEALTFAKEVGADGWATYIAAGDYEFEPENAFVVSSAGSSVALKSVTQVPSGTPLVLKGEGKKWVKVLGSAPDAPTNSLAISDGAGAGTTNDYVLGKKNGVAGFYRWNGGNLSANKVYLPAIAVSGDARELLDFEIETNNDVTTINKVQGRNVKNDGCYHNLAGLRVTQPTRGLYIVNGKKVVLK